MLVLLRAERQRLQGKYPRNLIFLIMKKDNVVWKRTPSGDVKRTPQERDAYFNDIISKREIYKEDYASITTYFEREPISYGEAIKSVEIIAISRS